MTLASKPCGHTASQLRILAVSPVSGYGGNNTSIHRIRALEGLGCEVDVLDSAAKRVSAWGTTNFRLRHRLFRAGLPVALPDLTQLNSRLLSALAKRTYEILWIERELSLSPAVLSQVRSNYPRTLIVGFSPDDMNGRRNQSSQFLRGLPLIDIYLTTKTYNVAELQTLGCPETIFIGNGFDPSTFRPLPVSERDVARLGGDVGFIGTYEADRGASIHFLASQGIRVRVWGNGWERMRTQHTNLRIEGKPLYGDDFARACRAFLINLAFLRKLNRDLQTTRSVEIPACGGFMLAERTNEHLDLFAEGEEAEFFSSREELLEKCRAYLTDEAERDRIAERGYQRCLSSGYSNQDRLASILPILLARLQEKTEKVDT